MRDGKWKFHTSVKFKNIQLYDLSKDPSESNNVATKYPNVVRELSAKMAAWLDELPKEYAKDVDKRNKKK